MGEESEDAVVSTCMLRAASPTAAINQGRRGEHLHAQGRESNGRDQ